MSLKVSVSLLTFCLDNLSMDVSGVLKSPLVIMLLSAFPFISVGICMYLGTPVLIANIFTIYVFFLY